MGTAVTDGGGDGDGDEDDGAACIEAPVETIPFLALVSAAAQSIFAAEKETTATSTREITNCTFVGPETRAASEFPPPPPDFFRPMEREKYIFSRLQKRAARRH